MPIRFACPGCGAQLSAPDEFVGKKANCKRCGDRFVIPKSTEAASPAAIPIKVAPVVAQPVSNKPSTIANAGPIANPIVAQPIVAIPVAAQPVSTGRIQASPVATVPARDAVPVRVAAARISETAVTKLQPDLLASAFTGTITRVPVSLGYKLSLGAVSMLMVLLPLVYIALIVAIIYATALYSVAGLSIFNESSSSGRRGAGLFLVYITPLVVGAITVIFMIKPFFARMPKSAKPRSITRNEQPLLFDFVDRICQAVGAPIPKRIDIDTDVNASASFRNGWLSLLQSNDLVLTIGMPLVRGLSVRELGGILAHEFGHFSQGMGMRLTYMIRSINMWFARVVYQRDRADEWLAGAAKNTDFRIAIVLYIAMAVVWLTRRVLWLLMMIGHIFSCMLMRQMEYDADSYEIQLAGTRAFGGTFNKLQRLGLAYQQSLEEAQEFFVDGKLVDDLPNLVRINRNMQSDELIQKLEEKVASNEGHWLDTHPTDAQRIAAAEKINAPGIFHLEAPADALFIDVDQLSKRVTRDFFETIFGDEFKESMLASVQQLTSFKQAAKEAEEARERMFSKAFTNPRAMHLGSPVDRGQPAAQSMAEMQHAANRMRAGLQQYEQDSQKFDEIDSRWLASQQASDLIRCGMKLKAKDWKELPVQSPPLLEATSQETLMELAQLHDKLLGFEQAFAARLDGALQWMFHQVQQNSNSPWLPSIEQAQSVLSTLAAMDTQHRALVDLRNDFAVIMTIFAVAGGNMTEKHVARITERGDRLKLAAPGLMQFFSAVPYPFEHAHGPMTLAKYLAPQADKIQEYSDALEVTGGLLKNYQYAYFRCVGTLAAIIEKVERAALKGRTA